MIGIIDRNGKLFSKATSVDSLVIVQTETSEKIVSTSRSAQESRQTVLDNVRAQEFVQPMTREINHTIIEGKHLLDAGEQAKNI